MTDPKPAPLRSVHTVNFPDLLRRQNASLLVTTYQAHKLVVLRADGDSINTHFRVFRKPMGLAVDGARLAIGAASQIWEHRNMPAVAESLDPPGKHDACFLPRNAHVSGDVDIHEMAWVEGELWFVNTRFSCLCTLDFDHSFVPRWRPPFVTALAPEDRCHLNGLALVDGEARYVTALGTSDAPAGWRERKADGGVLLEVPSGRVVASGLSMPHSPRWHRDTLWVLESGNGSLARVDTRTGELDTVAELPGFTRGLDFCGSLAFVGLSQVRESAVFSGIPLTERLEERHCGVWVVDVDTGRTVAFLEFEDAVQEIFAVQALPGIRFPEVVDWDPDLVGSSYVLPDADLADVPAGSRRRRAPGR